MKKIILLVLIINTFNSFSQITQVQEIKTDIINTEDYENLMRYKCNFYENKNSNHLYLKGFESDGAQLISIDNNLFVTRNLKLEKLPYNGVPKKIIETNTLTNILYHSGKTIYITEIDNKNKNINHLEFKTKIKNKHVISYLVTEKSFIVLYRDKKDNHNIKIWVYDFVKHNGYEKQENLGNINFEEIYPDLAKNIVTFSNSKNNTTELTIIDLENYKQKQIVFGEPDLTTSKTIFKSKIYNNKLIQVLKNNESTIIKKYDNYLNNRYYKSFQIKENNVNYYAKKNMFSKKNVESIDHFHEKTNKSTFIEIEPFTVNNTLSLFIDMKAISESSMAFPGGVGGVGNTVYSNNEYSVGSLRTSIHNNDLTKYLKLTPKETLKEFKNKVNGDLIMENNFELNNKVYLTYYDMQTKSLKILEFFK